MSDFFSFVFLGTGLLDACTFRHPSQPPSIFATFCLNFQEMQRNNEMSSVSSEERTANNDTVERNPLIVSYEGRHVSFQLKGPPKSSLEETKRKYFAFESRLRRKSADPSLYGQNLGVVEGQDVTSKGLSSDSSLLDSEVYKTVSREASPYMNLEDLFMVYDREKQKFLSSFVGQKIKGNVVFANRISRKLIFLIKPRENEKEILMESIFGFIHQPEVSRYSPVDPASYFKIGQIKETKANKLDFALEHILLSQKEITVIEIFNWNLQLPINDAYTVSWLEDQLVPPTWIKQKNTTINLKTIHRARI